MSSEIAFGIGCFHFTPIQEPPYELSGKEYAQNLEKALSEITNISEIDIITGERFEDLEIEVTEKIPRISDSTQYFPVPARPLLIKFKLYLPSRLLSELSSRILDTDSENFEVIIRYDAYNFPVTFVTPIGGGRESTPSDAVIAVFKFLRKKFKNHEEKKFRFERLGPSPFHANFYLQEKNGQSGEKLKNGLEYNIHKLKGYHKIDFFYQSDAFESINKAQSFLFNELKDEIAVFYAIVHSNLMQMNQWEEIQDKVGELIEFHQQKGFKASVKKFFSTFKSFNDAFIELANFEHHQSFAQYSIQKKHKNLNDHKSPVLEPYIKERQNDQTPYPTKQYRSLITLLESQRKKRIEGVVTLIAAILGGVIGSIITLVFSTQ